ncbi:MAG TPA: hypothetical protein VLN44_11320 [Pyrinomonadaceae bacterium]|nr:hypothetical protein [Pyrinomonadaceae bacterium]
MEDSRSAAALIGRFNEGTNRRAECLTLQTTYRRFAMFQLFDLIMTSAIGIFLVNAFESAVYAALLAGDCDECGFNDLGKLLFGGLILAILAGISLSLLYRRKHENGSTAQFVSIRSTKPED